MPEKAPVKESDSKGMPLKTILILAGVFVIEAVVIAGAFMLAGGPRAVEADSRLVEDTTSRMEEPVSVLVVEGKFNNTRTGRTYVYDAQIYVLVKRKYADIASGEAEARNAQLRDDVRTIISRAEPAQLTEPSLATIRRQMKERLEERLGRDEDGKSIILDVLVPNWTQYRADM